MEFLMWFLFFFKDRITNPEELLTLLAQFLGDEEKISLEPSDGKIKLILPEKIKTEIGGNKKNYVQNYVIKINDKEVDLNKFKKDIHTVLSDIQKNNLQQNTITLLKPIVNEMKCFGTPTDDFYILYHFFNNYIEQDLDKTQPSNFLFTIAKYLYYFILFVNLKILNTPLEFQCQLKNEENLMKNKDNFKFYFKNHEYYIFFFDQFYISQKTIGLDEYSSFIISKKDIKEENLEYFCNIFKKELFINKEMPFLSNRNNFVNEKKVTE